MVDMHMHTKYSDGDKTVAEILDMCEKRGLKYISITDHNTCSQYDDDAYINNRIFTGKIITGTEIYAVVGDKTIEILGYNVDKRIMNEFFANYFSEEKIKIQREISYKRLLNVCDKLGIKYIKERIEIPETGPDVERPIYKEIMSHEENFEILGEFTESFKIFYRKGLVNPNSKFYMHYSDFTPKYDSVIEAIHKAGGKAFLAHPFEYKIDNIIEFMDKIRKIKELDGIECFHPSANEERSRQLLDYCKQNNLFISGGSDYHGKKKTDIEVGIGNGSLNISEDIIKPWINK